MIINIIIQARTSSKRFSSKVLINLFKELGYRFYDIYNLKKIVDINKFILSIADGTSTTLIAK